VTDVADNFNRANGPLGSTWKISTSLSGGAGIVINNNQAANAGGTYRAQFISPVFATFDNDQYAEIDTTGNNSAGVVIRHNPSGASNFYAALRSTGGTTLAIYRWTGTAIAQLGTKLSGLPAGPGTVGLRATGNTLVASFNGADLITVTDNTYASGQPGMILLLDFADNFIAGPGTMHVIAGTMSATDAVDEFFAIGSAPLGQTGPSKFYFAWCDQNGNFGSSMLREDELIFSFEFQHDEGQFCELTLEIANPYSGLLAPDRKLWAWFSWSDGTTVTPLFFGRLLGIPDDLFAEIIKIKLVAKPADYAARQIALAKTLKVLPFYDPIFIDATKDKEDDPDTVLEGYSALWHVDRITHAVTISDIITGEDGVVDFSSDEVFYDSVKMTLAGAPLLMCEIEASVQWTQCGPGNVDTKTVPGVVGDKNPAPGVTFTQGVTTPADDFKWAKDPVQYTDTVEYKNTSPGPHSDGDLMEEKTETSVPMYYGETTSRSESHTFPDPETGQGEEYSIKESYKTTDSYYPAAQKTDPGGPVSTEPQAPNPKNSPVAIAADVSQNRVEDVYIGLRADVQPVLASLTLDQKDLTESLTINSRDLVEVGVATVYTSAYLSTPRGQQSIEYLLHIARAHLLAKSRVVAVEWECPFPKMIQANLSCRKNATIEDQRLPGTTVLGKIVSYSMSGVGDTGEFIGKVTINSAVGNYEDALRAAGAITAPGTPDYVDEGYVDPGYQHYSGALIAAATNDMSYELIPYVATGLQFPLTLDQVLLRHEYHDTGTPEGRAVINDLLQTGSAALRNFDFNPPPPPPPSDQTAPSLQATSPVTPTSPAASNKVPIKAPTPIMQAYIYKSAELDKLLAQALDDNRSWVEMEFAPLRDLFLRTSHTVNTQQLQVPKQIDLAAT
jgi:hypothetical protein